MEGPKRNEDKLNIIGIVAVGICGSVFVYVSVVLLQAFYMDETATVETMAEHEGQGNTYRSLRAAQHTYVTEYGRNAGGPDQPQTYRIPVDQAMAIVVEQGQKDPANLVPVVGRATTPTIKAVFGRPQSLQAPAPAAAPAGAAPAPAGAAPETAAPAGAPSAPAPTTGTPAGAGATPAPAAMTTRPVDAQQPAGIAPPAATPVPAPGATPPSAPTPAPKAAAPKAPKAPAKRAQGGNAP